MRGEASKIECRSVGDGRASTAILALLIALLLNLVLVSPTPAEDLRVEASVDTKNVSVGDNLTLTITVYGDGKINQPDLSNLDGFAVVSSYSSQNISIVNAKMSKSVSLQYVLTAIREGELTLGPFTVRSGKDFYQTEPIPVRVSAASGQQGGQAQQPGVTRQQGRVPQTQRGGEAAGEAVKVLASTDKRRAYVGEQITYTLTFAYRADVENAVFDDPDHTGFWSEPIGQTGTPTVKVIDGIQYYTITRTTAFFPISSGRFTIGEAGVRYIASDFGGFSRDPFSIFRGDPFRRREGAAAADPIEIEVLPLPDEGRPADFSGAVGSFRLSVVPSPRDVRLGESVTLSIRVEGRGNIKSIGDIPLPRLDGFRVFAPKARDSVRVEQGKIGGAKIFDLVLVPEVMGKAVLDGFSLTYFDPAKGAYVRSDAQPVEINVLEGDENAMRSLAASGDRLTVRQDIRHIKRVSHVGDDLTLLPGGALGVAVRMMPVLIGLAGVIVMVQRRHMATSGKAKVRRAFKRLARELREAEEMLGAGRPVDASAQVARAMRAYIAERKGTSESLIDAACVGAMEEISEETRGRVCGLLTVLDQVRFAPAGSSPDEMRRLVGEAEAVMRKVDEEWK